ncbi:kinesin KIN12B [Olea europaea subsp. europaea]|uniref:Kinesin KIN12B n=1 Tax=Olea europaea subsp. europaea TaxID=158383 RepID=A0A8S0SYP3_OLEEU|nr:kinesin KIN12B [Olea europaea subsp. europaea]
MKHFMMPRNQILRENYESAAHTPPSASPNPKCKLIAAGSPSNRRHKSSKENADPNSIASPATAKLKSPLPPRPTLKRKLTVEAAVGLENSAGPANSADSGVKVIVRIRPPNKVEEDGGSVIQKLSNDSLSIAGQTFTFDSVADIESTQIDIFQLIGAPLVENCLAGFNSSVFAYGQTGSGKTYTIWGASNALLEERDQQGLTPRVCQRLFERINEEQEKHADKQLVYMCRCSFLEIYNEQITDLLDTNQKNLQIREDVKSGVYVENLTEECVSSMEDVSQLLIKGLSNRRTSSTTVNAESSRSHSVFTYVVESRSKSMADGGVSSSLKMSRINFVDLAGSERQKQTGAAGDRLKEAGNINRSLSQLGNLINILAEVSQTGKQRHIPYRDSKLTFLLQESLGGNAKLAMICAVSPAQSCKSETLSTLRFAQRAKAIKNKAVVNEEIQDDVNVLRQVIRQLRDELHRMKANDNQTGQVGAYSTGWNARRSLNLLKFSLKQPMTLPHIDDDTDEEMEIVEEETVGEDTDVNMEDEAFERVDEDKNNINNCAFTERKSDIALPNSDSYGHHTQGECVPSVLEKIPNEDCAVHNHCTVPTDMLPVLKSPTPSVSPRLSSSRKSCFTSTEHLAAALHHGLDVIGSHRRSAALGRSSFRFSCIPSGSKAVIPVVKVDAGVQTFFTDDELSEKDSGEFLCSKCKTKNSQQELIEENNAQNLQLVPVNRSLSHEKLKKVPKEVEKVLAGAIRREMALEDICAKQTSEIMQLNRLVQQYRHERECNAIIGQTREDKIARLESLMDGILPTEEFMEHELLSLTHEHKILQEKYDNHPEILRTKIELRRVQDELERYKNFFELGERDVLMEEIQDLKDQLQLYLNSSSKTSKGPAPLLRLKYSCEPSVAPPLSSAPEATEESAEEKLQKERNQWTETESKWISLVEELRLELESRQSLVQKQKQELDMEKKCSEELKEAMQMAMEGHARMLEQYADLEVKHIQLLARQRKIREGIEDVKKAAAKAGVRGAESKFINALAAEISALRVEQEKERRYFRDENKGLQAQLRDTAEAVQAAGELVVRLKEAEEAIAAAENRAIVAEGKAEKAYKERDRLSRLLAADTQKLNEGFAADGRHVDDGNQQWQEEFAPSYDIEEDPSSWFAGYDRCNI